MSEAEPILTWKQVEGPWWHGSFKGQEMFWAMEDPQDGTFLVFRADENKDLTGHHIGYAGDLDEAKAIAERAVPALLQLAAAEASDE